MSKTIICIDMDAFFASVEQQANPKLRGKPVAVIGSGARTVIMTRSYEARKYGVKTGMNIYEARKLCPDLIFVTGDNGKYTHTCKGLKKIYLKYTPEVEVYSIDEAFLDVTDTQHLFGGPAAIGDAIKTEIKWQFGITCTAGIAPNILLAKLASDLGKPDGLKWIRAEEAEGILNDLPVKELWGIGPETTAKLASLGIRTCGELGRVPASLLRSRFGITGESLKSMGLGLCNRPLIVREEDPKSIGHSMTLRENIYNRSEMETHILRLSEMVGRRARKYGFTGRRVALTIRYPDFETFSRQAMLNDYTNHTHEIYHKAVCVLDGIRLKGKVRLLGITLSDLIKETGQMELFGGRKKEKALISAMDMVNDKYGDFKLSWASYLRQTAPSGVISPAWRPSGIRHREVR